MMRAVHARGRTFCYGMSHLDLLQVISATVRLQDTPSAGGPYSDLLCLSQIMVRKP